MKQETGTGPDHSFSIHATVCQKRGIRHRLAAERCEDVIFHLETPDLLFWGLADGQSGKPCGTEGGLASLKAVAGYIQTQGIAAVLHTPFPDELPCLFMQEIRRQILSLARKQHREFSDYGSTLLAIAVDPASAQYVLLHLGDGYAMHVGASNDVSLLSAPENGLTSCHTWLTTTKNNISHFRLSFGHLNQKKRILLFSDGVQCFCQGKNISRRAREQLTGPVHGVASFLAGLETEDDSSCIILEIVSSESV